MLQSTPGNRHSCTGPPHHSTRSAAAQPFDPCPHPTRTRAPERRDGQRLQVEQLRGGGVLLGQDEVAEGDGQHRLAAQPLVAHNLGGRGSGGWWRREGGTGSSSAAAQRPLASPGLAAAAAPPLPTHPPTPPTRMKYCGGRGSATGSVNVTRLSSSASWLLSRKYSWCSTCSAREGDDLLSALC